MERTRPGPAEHRPSILLALAVFVQALVLAESVPAFTPSAPRTVTRQPELTPAGEDLPDIVGDVEAATHPAKTTGDTTWVADWNFDLFGGACDDTGWTRLDLRILNDGSNYWYIDDAYDPFTGITGNAAVLGRSGPCVDPYDQAYEGNWDYSVRLAYVGASQLDFDYLLDPGQDGNVLRVESDSSCSSEGRVDYGTDPTATPADFRVLVHSTGMDEGHVTVALPDFGAPSDTHCVYVRFATGLKDCNQDYEPCGFFLGAALVVDHVQIAGGLSYAEDFEGALDPHVGLVNSGPSVPFGEWARPWPHPTDNSVCTENTTCAWIWSDPTLPASDPAMAFGPGGAVIRNWLDDIIVGPWASLSATSGAQSTLLSFRRFPGNTFSKSKIVQNWSVRTRQRRDNTDTPAPGDSTDCVSLWGHAMIWSSLNAFNWVTSVSDMTAYVPAGASDIQVRFRVSDWQYIDGAAPPATLGVGPGPYLDRVRIGRRLLLGPILSEGIDSRSQAQDCLPTYRNGILPGEHYWPTTDRFGTCAFSEGTELGVDSHSYRLITGDSIWISVTPRSGTSVASVDWHGAIVVGPHAGKAPPPYTVGANGFFAVTPDSCRSSSGSVVQGRFFVDFDESYFRGGDVLLYFWTATDNAGGFASDPVGLAALPGSVTAAEQATGGLLEVSFLPEISWDPGYLARIAAHPSGRLDPTPEELAGSHQANCILYYQLANTRRRSGPTNRTSFMYTLDRLGYRGYYDVYDVQGFGNTGNQLPGRATYQQLTGYALLAYDTGRVNFCTMPDSMANLMCGKFDQSNLFRSYLSQAATSEIGTATLWILGENALQEKPTAPIYATTMGLVLVSGAQTLAASPDVEGQTPFTWASGWTSDFTGESFALAGQCAYPTSTNLHAGYDALGASGTATITHRYRAGANLGDGAIVMKSNAPLAWNTVFCAFPWFDIRDLVSAAPGTPAFDLAGEIVRGALPDSCRRDPDPVDVPPGGEIDDGLPKRTVLYGNVPNPFNPATTIRFDLARAGDVDLAIYDVAGRRVATLVHGWLPRERHAASWNGQDAGGREVASGVYFYRLATPDLATSRKLLVVR